MVSRPIIALASAALGLAALSSGPAFAGEPDAPASKAPPAAKPKNDKSKRVCRTVEPTGSRFTQRICRSAAEWDEAAQRAERYVADGNRSGSSRDGEFNGREMLGAPR